MKVARWMDRALGGKFQKCIALAHLTVKASHSISNFMLQINDVLNTDPPALCSNNGTLN